MKHNNSITLFGVIAVIAIVSASNVSVKADEMVASLPLTASASTSSPVFNTVTLPAPDTSRLIVHGSFFERYRDDINHSNGGITSQGSVTYGTLRADYTFARDLSLFGRVGGEGITQGGQGRDMNGSFYTGSHGYRGALAVDQGGFTYSNQAHGLTIVAGRQDKPLDATSTIYDQSWKVGLYSFLDGVSIDQTLGRATLELDAFSEDQYRTIGAGGEATRDGLYAGRATYAITPSITLGSLVGRFEASSISERVGVGSTTNYEGDVVWQATKALQLKAEGGKSDASTRNDLYFGSAKYTITPQDSLTAVTYKIAENADFGQGTAYPNNNRGARYFYEHDFSKQVSLTFFHEIDHQLYGPGNSSSDQATIGYSF